MDINYWNKPLETIDRPSLSDLQLKLLRETVDRALKTVFYKRRLQKAGIHSGSDLKSLSDLKRIPYTTKADLREAYPAGLLAVDPAEVIRLHTSSGTTGTPTVIYHTRQDIDHWTELCARSIVATGCTKRDIFQNMMSYGLFTGGLGLHYGAEKVGLTVIPAAAGNTPRQIRLMKDFGTTAVHATPSYLLHVQSKIVPEGFQLSELKLKKAFLGAESYSESTRRKIEELMKIDAYNSYGLSEMNGPGVAFECIYKDNMHLWEDHYILEMLDPGNQEELGEDAEGELVLTTLRREATPVLRYRTGDLTRLDGRPCPCGRTHRRIARIKGRTDDMLIINGVNVYPSQIEAVLMKIPEVGTNYQIYVEKEGALDRMTIKTEIYSKMFTGDLQAVEGLKRKIRESMRTTVLLNPNVELHEPGGLPVYEGKAKRVFDNRPKD